MGSDGSLAMRRRSVSTISLKGVDFIGCGVVAIAVLVVSIYCCSMLAVCSSGAVELLSTYKGFLVSGAALYHSCSGCLFALIAVAVYWLCCGRVVSYWPWCQKHFFEYYSAAF